MRAIDTHVHFSTAEGYLIKDQHLMKAMETYYRIKVEMKTEEEMAKDFTDLEVKAILLPVDADTALGFKTTNDYAASLVRQFPETFIGAFAAIDPWKGAKAVKELERAVKELGMIGVKFQQAMQAFYPNDKRFYPIYQKAMELKVPILFHGGTTGLGAGLPGGGGIRLCYTRPIPYIDDVACDFPDLTVIIAHPGWPWVEEQIAVLLHKANVYMDLSGWAPKYFPDA
ncbi:MAG: amidohydrolase family protein, partial [Dehalococcoidia bacterium]|nr:amidohydrolase family protein [Dehalococcoidia bacterium]